ncbi:UDP-N-acetylmuramate--L-alanine ligase, partial [Marinifilum sp. JC120]
MAVALQSGVSAEELHCSIREFEGVVRRFDARFKFDNCVYIDDYAHHPKELEAVISSVKELYPDR